MMDLKSPPSYVAGCYGDRCLYGRKTAKTARGNSCSFQKSITCCASLVRNVSAERGIFACRQYGFVPDTQQWDECMKYVGSKRPPLLRP